MAIFHLSAKIVSRSHGRSCTAAAAYRAGEKIHDPRTGLDFDYRRRRHVAYKEILLPSGAPAWASNRAALWQAVEASEVRKDAQLCREIEISLPHELSRREQIKLVQDYLKRCFVSKGMVCDLCIHQNPGNVHAHVLVSMREIGPGGFGAKSRRWNQRGLLDWWRQSWSRSVNTALARRGIPERIDHRSLVAQANQEITKENVIMTKTDAIGEIGTPTTEAYKPLGMNLSRPTPIFELVAAPDEAMPADLFDSDAALEQFREMLSLLFRERKVIVSRIIEAASEGYKVVVDDRIKLKIHRDKIACATGSAEEIAAAARIAKEFGWTRVSVNGSEEFRKMAYVALLAVGYEPEDITGYTPEEQVKPEIPKLTTPSPWKRGRK